MRTKIQKKNINKRTRKAHSIKNIYNEEKIVLTFLEIAVCMIQAYVFTLLTCIYLNDAINLH